MKILNIIFTLSLLTSISLSVIAQKNDNQCECYCSEKCGPRKIGEASNNKVDKPFYSKEHNKCFCQQRDFDNYDKKKHPEHGGVTCKVKEQSNPTTLNPNCCGLDF